MIKILLIDNFDSFTFNIFQYVSSMGYDIEVKRNDSFYLKDIEESGYTHIIISPGPGTPDDAGISLEAIKRYAGKLPILGICLGHQAIGRAFGGEVVRAKKIHHGKLSRITHNGKGIFAGLKNPFMQTRYHSLVLRRSTLPECLEITARSSDGEIQGIKHRDHKIYGVQFHPESIASECGRELLENFIKENKGGNIMKEYIKKVMAGTDLSVPEAEQVMEEIAEGHASPPQIASILTALSIKGETVEELTGFAKVMISKAAKVRKPEGRKVADLVGTGGDGASTFNISTVSSLVCAGAGLTMAKHGNRSVTSKCGAADLLEALGVNLDIDAETMSLALEKTGIAFLFAPKLHSSMKYAVPVRRDLEIRTVFNILGPLTNPANPSYQVIGVFDRKLVKMMAQVLSNLGRERGLVCHGSDGLDEITLTGKTYAAEIKDGWIREFEIDPADYGFSYCSEKDITGGDIKENKEIALNILNGGKGPKRDIVVLNAGVTIFTAKKAETIEEGIKMAEYSIDSGMALKKLNSLADFTNGR